MSKPLKENPEVSPESILNYDMVFTDSESGEETTVSSGFVHTEGGLKIIVPKNPKDPNGAFGLMSLSEFKNPIRDENNFNIKLETFPTRDVESLYKTGDIVKISNKQTSSTLTRRIVGMH